MHRLRTAAITFLFAAMVTQARAEAIFIDISVPTIAPNDVTLIGTTGINKSLSVDALEDLWDVELGSLLYKSEVDDGDEYGAAAPYYTTTYSDSSNDPANALITWQGPGIVSCPACYLLVKGGRATSVSQYLFDLGSWDGQDSIILAGFWPDRGAISHVALFSPAIAIVPEPASLTLMLLGIGTVGAARYRSRRRS
jgi:hypothetical protein